ncbi:hypothetical protein AB1Y20_003733 [Prymnesium parvum]|uniref:RRM domain-containing protein n=1 Tax=Prymnesium parvum TaxID=97485 RepID=A0AB34J7E3_PRYPA
MLQDAAPAARPPEYYYTAAGGSPLGPCTVPQFRVLWISGHIHRDTSVWREGMASWVPVHEVPELAEVLLQLQQPPALQNASELWYCSDASSGRQRSGLTTQQMGVLLRNGEIDGETHVWRQGMAEWCELGSVAELKSELMQNGDDEEDESERARAADAIRIAQETVAFDPSAPDFDVPTPAKPAPIAAEPADPAAKPKRVRKNKPKFVQDGRSNVYVSGVPPTTSNEELLEHFKVAGLLKHDPDTGAPKIKRYTDANGQPKGDALITFLKPESVALAVTLRDGFEIEPGVSISVAPAKFELRGEPKLKSKRLGKDAALQRKKQKLLEERQLAQWEDSLLTSSDGKRQCTAIIFGIFDPEEATAAGSDFYANLKQDIEVESKKAGEMEKVTIFEGSERGVAAVRFKNADDAEKYVAMMNERHFGTNQLSCELYDGVSDYRVKPKIAEVGGSGNESVDEQQKNLEGFASWLEGESTDEELVASGDEN